MKIKNPKKIFITFLAVFIISAGFLFVEAKPASAGKCTFWQHLNGECNPNSSAEGASGEAYKAAVEISDPGTCSLGWMTSPIVCALLVFVKIVKLFLNYALDFFSWMIDANRFTSVLQGNPLYETWGMVRDICNIGFIMILLFSAFSTVFQYSKYNYKNILLWLVIMALLVNFSYPITLFVIDLTNSLMYTILKSTFPSGAAKDALFNANGGFAALESYVKTVGTDSSATTLFFLVVFIFILALTIIALALILLIRLLALSIILILSPIGFVGIIIGKDGGWWNSLFKYAMAGPIIAIVLMLCVKLMSVSVMDNSPATYEGVPIAMIRFTIPIVILWMGMAMAIKGIDGAGTILGKAQGYAKAAGKKLSGYNYAKSQYSAFAASRKKRREEIEKKKYGGKLGDKVNNIQDKFLANRGSEKAKKRYNKRNEQSNKDDIKSESEKNDGVGTIDLVNDTTNGVTKNILTRPTSKSDKIAAAGRVKQLMSRGKEFEMEVENSIADIGNADIQTFINNEITAGRLAPGTTRADVNKVKAAYYAQARTLIKEAELHDNI